MATKEFRVLVCGGRDYADFARVKVVLDQIHARRPITLLINGDARGADKLAQVWAKMAQVCRFDVPAEWDLYGKAAGPQRNTRMFEAKPDLVIAFPGGSGTRDMAGKAEAVGVRIFYPEGRESVFGVATSS